MEREKGEVEMIGDGDEFGYDALVIGSGYGGSVAACRLSMAGVNVNDFPTNFFKITKNLGVSFGPKEALFQDDSLAALACGIGGGSLVNAGVMIPTPVTVRRNSKWPKEWEYDWDIFEASASSMLRAQTIPVEFSNAKECYPNSMKLSMNINGEESQSSIKMGSCLACGNYLSGCPYNAKNSTDKNYLALAVQFDCTIKTECEVQFVVRNFEEICEGVMEISESGNTDGEFITMTLIIVFGTVKILFQSERKGLRVSDQLDCGFSCNGNNVGFITGSPAPLNAQGFNKKQFSKTSFQDPPGPSISASYTSSLGFTIQSAVLPAAFPSLLFKGITTYGWPIGCWFLHGLIDKLMCMMRVIDSQVMVLNVMGHDDSDGRITLEKNTNNICFTFQKPTKRLGGIFFISRYRSTSVRLLGGCNASSDPSKGVCNSNGQVFDPQSPSTVHPDLYVCDASLIPCSIGINSCLTIATAAEHVSRNLVQDSLTNKKSTYLTEFSTPKLRSICKKLETGMKSTVIIRETITGYLGGMPCTAYLTIKMNSPILKGSNESNLVCHSLLRGRVGGYVVLEVVEKNKLYVIGGEVDMCRVDKRTPYTQYMYYHLILTSASRKKIMNPYLLALYAWKETTTLHVTLRRVNQSSLNSETLDIKGELHLSVVNLLKSLISLEGNKRGRFIGLLLHSFWRTYILQIPRGNHVHISSSGFSQKPYPKSDIHEMMTGNIIKTNISRSSKSGSGLTDFNLFFLSCLPTEPKDSVRTLLEEGYETWLLQARLHPFHPSNDSTIEDIGKFDIPAAISKILELHGDSVKVHVVAHCVGGLAIHIALMGGHISTTHIACLCCTNSSMFFKLTMSSLIKMRLPLIPISMKILGINTILPLLATSKKISLRHRLLKCIARVIPRYERCTLDECEVFSGIFGNTFWHINISSTMHQWLNKQSLPHLPLFTFPHLRKICLSGFIVNSDGANTYLIHPERMKLPTTYISGGKSLLVTPETSFLANQYMKLPQPCYKHTWVVLEDCGHSDFLIGENSWKFVLPHILSHIKSADENEEVRVDEESNYRKEALSWNNDPYQDRSSCGNLVSPSIIFLFSCFVCCLLCQYCTNIFSST
ncbi:hypothetical protein MKX01_012743 [Papaver californicum]|nr:hypothetical protein MKX01_012743 [Papaver californicum]